MNLEYLMENGVGIAVVSGSRPFLVDPQSALELAMTVRYETGAKRIAIDKRVVCGDFFILSTGLAGEILQKWTNYQIKAAIYGDYSHYTSRPLKDFIYESNRGRDIFFVSTREEAVQRLAAAE